MQVPLLLKMPKLHLMDVLHDESTLHATDKANILVQDRSRDELHAATVHQVLRILLCKVEKLKTLLQVLIQILPLCLCTRVCLILYHIFSVLLELFVYFYHLFLSYYHTFKFLFFIAEFFCLFKICLCFVIFFKCFITKSSCIVSTRIIWNKLNVFRIIYYRLFVIF